MRDHLLAIQEITAHLADKQFDAAAEVAETRLGSVPCSATAHHEVAQYMPEGMRQLGHGMHQAPAGLRWQHRRPGLPAKSARAARAIAGAGKLRELPRRLSIAMIGVSLSACCVLLRRAPAGGPQQRHSGCGYPDYATRTENVSNSPASSPPTSCRGRSRTGFRHSSSFRQPWLRKAWMT